MKSIFISYAREDKEAAGALAGHLNEKGYRVWWDEHLIIGEEFRKKILAELDDADKVVVIWTKHSVDSSFVIAEAERAKAGEIDSGADWRVRTPHGFWRSPHATGRSIGERL